MDLSATVDTGVFLDVACQAPYLRSIGVDSQLHGKRAYGRRTKHEGHGRRPRLAQVEWARGHYIGGIQRGLHHPAPGIPGPGNVASGCRPGGPEVVPDGQHSPCSGESTMKFGLFHSVQLPDPFAAGALLPRGTGAGAARGRASATVRSVLLSTTSLGTVSCRTRSRSLPTWPAAYYQRCRLGTAVTVMPFHISRCSLAEQTVDGGRSQQRQAGPGRGAWLPVGRVPPHGHLYERGHATIRRGNGGADPVVDCQRAIRSPGRVLEL